MTDERPRPQYGEYATPEEQVKAGGASGAAHVGKTGIEPSAQSGLTPSVFSPRGFTAGGPAGAAGAPLVRRPWDLSITVFLLALNAYLVLTSIPDWLNLGVTLATGYTQLGYGDYTSTELANSVGLGIVAVQVALLISVLYFAIKRLRAQRRAFPITLGLGLLAVVLTMVLLMVAMTSDPALAAYIATQSGN
jgi:hypothetical protein